MAHHLYLGHNTKPTNGKVTSERILSEKGHKSTYEIRSKNLLKKSPLVKHINIIHPNSLRITIISTLGKNLDIKIWGMIWWLLHKFNLPLIQNQLENIKESYLPKQNFKIRENQWLFPNFFLSSYSKSIMGTYKIIGFNIKATQTIPIHVSLLHQQQVVPQNSFVYPSQKFH